MEEITEEEMSLSAIDITIFAAMLVIPSSIGVYFAYVDRRSSSTKNYYFGGRKMNPVAVGVSTAVTSISAITMIGYPAEVYMIGTVFAWVPISVCLAAVITVLYYLPLYCRLRLDTIYQYLELRFNKTAMRICAGLVPISEIFYMGVAVFTPALALNAVTPISLTWSIAGTSLICTFYTTLGGMKAVIWTDVMQAVLMMSALFAILVGGLLSVGGFGEVFSSLERGERLTFLSSKPFDISSRMSTVAVTFGEFFTFNQYLSFSQPIYQRIQSCKTERQSRISIVAYIIPALLIICASIFTGLVMYAYFEGCDPVKSGRLERLDQAAPLMALQVFRNLPGMSGIYIAAVFSGTLSTVSSGLNAFSVVLLEGFLIAKYPSMSQRVRVICGKVIAIILGILVMLLAYTFSALDSNIFKGMRSILGSVAGPILGIYVLGMFIPWANSAGAITGMCAGFGFMIFILLGSNFFMTAPSTVLLPPVHADQCINGTSEIHLNQTTVMTPFSTADPLVADARYSFDQVLFSVNFHYYVFMGASVTIIIGLLVSFATGAAKASEADPELFIPLLDNPRFPLKLRKFFRFGVPERQKDGTSPNDLDQKSRELQQLNQPEMTED